MRTNTPTLHSFAAYGLSITLLLLSANLMAQDNSKPASWKNINVKIQETYGNNQSRPMRGAKVLIELDPQARSGSIDANADRQLAGRKPRLPQTKTSGSRGATFSRMPPSNLVGAYRVTVTPTNKNCPPKSKTFLHSNQRAHSAQFHFTCFGSGNTASSKPTRTAADPNICHQVRINSTGSQARLHTPVTVEACPGSNGLWTIKPFKY